MRAQGYGRIVTIGSTGGRFTSPGAGAYHTVKYAIEALSLSMGAEVAPFGVRVVLIDPTGVRTPFVSSQFETEHSYPDDDPYGDFKIRYSETTRRLATAKGLTVGADTVARAVVRVVKAKNPKPRYIIGASGKASILARALLSDRMWNRVMTAGMRG
jgi:NAD(P)-dependent dehydrogenase (short-subunit alcohol dehydrogenase family)